VDINARRCTDTFFRRGLWLEDQWSFILVRLPGPRYFVAVILPPSPSATVLAFGCSTRQSKGRTWGCLGKTTTSRFPPQPRSSREDRKVFCERGEYPIDNPLALRLLNAPNAQTLPRRDGKSLAKDGTISNTWSARRVVGCALVAVHRCSHAAPATKPMGLKGGNWPLAAGRD
jgi:hypothetical protein